MKITYLGPKDATFTAVAYEELAKIFHAPRTGWPSVKLHLAKANDEVVDLVLLHGGYGAIAMETKAEGRVDPPINSFIELLKKYNDGECPLRIIGALRMKVNFVLMARPGMTLRRITKIIAHPKALGACKMNIMRLLGVTTIEVASNGVAAHLVATNKEFQNAAALAPLSAKEQYGLDVLRDTFEDEEAITTFYLLGPREGLRCPMPQVPHRTLIVFRLPHVSGALVKVLMPLAKEGINLRLIHSLHTKDGAYDFAIEIECFKENSKGEERALQTLRKHTERMIQFGPFPVL